MSSSRSVARASRLSRHGRPLIAASLLLATLALFPATTVYAGRVPDVDKVADGAVKPRTTYSEMVRQFKSVTCQGETLDQCTSRPSETLKASIRQMVDAGWTKEQIIDAVVAEFGEKILAVSPRRGFAWSLWILPAIGLGIGVIALAGLLKRRSRGAEPRQSITLPAELDPYLQRVELEIDQGK